MLLKWYCGQCRCVHGLVKLPFPRLPRTHIARFSINVAINSLVTVMEKKSALGEGYNRINLMCVVLHLSCWETQVTENGLSGKK